MTQDSLAFQQPPSNATMMGDSTTTAVGGHDSGPAGPNPNQDQPAEGFDQEAQMVNSIRVYYGLLREPELANISLPDDDEREERSAGGAGGGPGGSSSGAGLGGSSSLGGAGDESIGLDSNLGAGQTQEDRKKKKKLSKKDRYLSKKSRNDPNAPSLYRIPLPEMRDTEKMDRLMALKESSRRHVLGPDALPSVCFYTFLNSQHVNQSAVLCAQVSEDTTMVAAGLADSTVRIWSLTRSELRGIKPGSELEQLDKEADDVTHRMVDHAADAGQGYTKVMCGHSGPVYGISFSPDRTLLLSCSEDSTVRLWSLLTWTNICCYKGHCYPIWDVKFSPLGYYFATCSHDRTARLWATDSHQPLRIFVGHTDDVDILEWHHNSNYIATGSSDKCVRLWDNLDGRCCRLFVGHRDKISALIFSPCGRFVVSGSADERIIMWDIPSAAKFIVLAYHVDTIYSLAFSRCGALLVSGGADDQVALWDYQKLMDEHDPDYAGLQVAAATGAISGTGSASGQTNSGTGSGQGTGSGSGPGSGPEVVNVESLILAGYRTKTTNVMSLHFTRRNLLIAAGVFH